MHRIKVTVTNSPQEPGIASKEIQNHRQDANIADCDIDNYRLSRL